MERLNSGKTDRHNYFIQTNFQYPIIVSDSVDNVKSGNM